MNSRHPHSLLTQVLILILVPLIVQAVPGMKTVQAQKVGDAIVVTRDHDTKIADKVVGKVYAGGVYRVLVLNDKWCAIDGVDGWLPRQYCLPLNVALDQYSRRIAANRRDVDALATRAMIYLERGDHARAFHDLNEALKIDNKRPNFWNNRGLAYIRLNQIDKALADINYAIKLAPEYANAFYNRGLCYYATSQFDKALEDFNKAVELDPKASSFLLNRAVTLQALGQQEKALADFDAALALRPSLAEALIGKSNIMLGRGDLKAAEEFASAAILANEESADAHNNRGWIRFKADRVEEALRDFERALAIDKGFSKAYSNRGVLLTETGQFDKAIADLNKALELEKDSLLTYVNRGNAWMGKKEYDKARADFNKALDLGPDDPEALNAKAWFLAVCSDEQYRDGEKSLELAKKACEASQMRDWTHIDTLAAAHAANGQFAEAVGVQEKAIEAAPENKKEICRTRLELYRNQKPYIADSRR